MAFLDLSKLWERRPDRLGIDLSGRSVRVMRIKRQREKMLEVSSCGTLDLSTSRPSSQDLQKLRIFIKQIGGGLTRAAIKIEDSSLRIRRMNFAKMPERDLIEGIKWNFREHIDCPIEEYEVGYTPIAGWGDADKITCAAFGIARRVLKEYQLLAHEIGVKPVSFEPQASALLAAFDYNLMWETKHAIVAVSLGERMTHFSVMADGQLLFSRPMPGVSLEALGKLIARDLSIDEKNARDMLRSHLGKNVAELSDIASASNDQSKQLLDTMSQFYSQLVVETQRSIDAFCIMFGVDRVAAIYLCDCGAYAPGIVENMQKSLGVTTRIFDPFARVMSERLSPEVKASAAIFTVALGLAIP